MGANPSMPLFNSKNVFIYLSLLFFYLHPANFMLIISYMYIHKHDSLQTIAALALPTCSKYTSKEGLELLKLLTMELCFVKKKCYRIWSALCNMHDLSHFMRPCMQ